MSQVPKASYCLQDYSSVRKDALQLMLDERNIDTLEKTDNWHKIALLSLFEFGLIKSGDAVDSDLVAQVKKWWRMRLPDVVETAKALGIDSTGRKYTIIGRLVQSQDPQASSSKDYNGFNKRAPSYQSQIMADHQSNLQTPSAKDPEVSQEQASSSSTSSTIKLSHQFEKPDTLGSSFSTHNLLHQLHTPMASEKLFSPTFSVEAPQTSGHDASSHALEPLCDPFFSQGLDDSAGALPLNGKTSQSSNSKSLDSNGNQPSGTAEFKDRHNTDTLDFSFFLSTLNEAATEATHLATKAAGAKKRLEKQCGTLNESAKVLANAKLNYDESFRAFQAAKNEYEQALEAREQAIEEVGRTLRQ